MKLKREIFKRPTRMVHTFGEQMGRDPFVSNETFEAPQPVGFNHQVRSTKTLNIQQYGQREWLEPRSPVIKPNGRAASINGPAPDFADEFATPIPASTKKRKQR